MIQRLNIERNDLIQVMKDALSIHFETAELNRLANNVFTACHAVTSRFIAMCARSALSPHFAMIDLNEPMMVTDDLIFMQDVLAADKFVAMCNEDPVMILSTGESGRSDCCMLFIGTFREFVQMEKPFPLPVCFMNDIRKLHGEAADLKLNHPYYHIQDYIYGTYSRMQKPAPSVAAVHQVANMLAEQWLQLIKDDHRDSAFINLTRLDEEGPNKEDALERAISFLYARVTDICVVLNVIEGAQSQVFIGTPEELEARWKHDGVWPMNFMVKHWHLHLYHLKNLNEAATDYVEKEDEDA